jgi:hypothetical protein
MDIFPTSILVRFTVKSPFVVNSGVPSSSISDTVSALVFPYTTNQSTSLMVALSRTAGVE